MFKSRINPSISSEEIKFIETRYEDTFELIFKEQQFNQRKSSKIDDRSKYKNQHERFDNIPEASNHRLAWDLKENNDAKEFVNANTNCKRVVKQGQIKSSVCVII